MHSNTSRDSLEDEDVGVDETVRRHVGHTDVYVDSSDSVPNSHVSIQRLWKQWSQSSTRISSPSSNKSRHIAQLGRSSVDMSGET